MVLTRFKHGSSMVKWMSTMRPKDMFTSMLIDWRPIHLPHCKITSTGSMDINISHSETA